MKKHWVIRDENTGEVIGEEDADNFNDESQIIEEYRHLPNHYTVKLEEVK